MTSNATETTPEPESAAFAASCTAGPPTTAPPAGAVTDPVGSVLSTRAVRAALVPELPPPSVAIARRSQDPSASGVVSSGAPKPSPGVVSVAIVVQAPAPAGLRWNTTCTVSAATVAESATAPASTEPGSSSETVGATLSMLTVTVAEIVSFPATSVTTTWRSAGPSA